MLLPATRELRKYLHFVPVCSEFTLYSLLREPLGIILQQKIGYFMSYQSLPFQFTLIAGDQSKQRNYFSSRARYMTTDSCKNSTVYNAYNLWYVWFVWFVWCKTAFGSFLSFHSFPCASTGQRYLC